MAGVRRRQTRILAQAAERHSIRGAAETGDQDPAPMVDFRKAAARNGPAKNGLVAHALSLSLNRPAEPS